MNRFVRNRQVFVAGVLPVVLCIGLLFALDAQMAQGAPFAPDTLSPACFATLGATTQYSSADASAVQQAVDAAGAGALVKIAGDCAGVQARGGATQTVYISRTLLLRGGYTTSNWTVSDPLANPTILDAKRQGGVVNGTADLSLAALTVQNGSVTLDGAASGAGIRAGGNVTLSQLTVVSNTLTCRGQNVNCFGPGAYAPGNAGVERSLFLDNTCAITVTFGCYGALYVGGSAELSSTQFISNGGGGAYVFDSVIVTSSQFVSNTNAGGLQVRNSALVSGSRFLSNTITIAGGGLSVYNSTNSSGTATVVNSLFSGNVGSSALNSGGGGMYAVTATVIHSQFIANLGLGAGGGLLAGNVLVSGKIVGGATVVDSQFISNSATAGGGGLFSSGSLVLTATDFISNSASSGGGGAAYVSATVSGGLFRANGATSGAGGLLVDFGPLRLDGTKFISNTAGGIGGGALYAQRAATLTGALFRDNLCGGTNCLGGALYVSNILTVSVTQFLSNTASMGGAVYALSGGTLHGSCVAGNQQAAVTNAGGTLDATNNWWGAVNGPGPSIGSGDAISGTVSAVPFLTTPIFACPSLNFGLKQYLPLIMR